MNTRSITRRAAVLGAAAVILAGLAACSSTATPSQSSGPAVKELTVWARSNAIGEGLFAPLVKAWNAGHSMKVNLTLIPSAELPAKLAASAGANQMPDIVISDVGNLPSLMKQGVLQDLAPQLKTLAYRNSLAPSAIAQGTDGSKRYAVPADVDPSLMYVNTTLLGKAGVSGVPSSLKEIQADSQKVAALNDGSSGFYAAGSCGGCLAFTTDPTIWAAGGQVVDGKGGIKLDTPAMRSSLQFYKSMWAAGAMPADSKADTGANWANVFAPGKIAVQFNGSSLLSSLKKAEVPFSWDVAGIPGPDGGKSSYIGGDTFSVTKDAKSIDAAWKFISWSLADKQQVDQYAKNGWLTVRTDLTDNKYTAADPRVKKVNDLIKIGKTPKTPYSAQVFNDPTGPWLSAFQQAVYGGDVSGALVAAQKQADALVAQG